MNLEIYDCTLREGEQADGASFSFNDRIELCKKLDEFGVDYIELGWPLASKEISDSFKEAINIIKKANIVAFGSTSIKKDVRSDENINSLIQCGAKYVCIFGKSDMEHVEKQLKISREENLRKIFESVRFLKENRLNVFYDAEHYFDGFKKNKDYALKTLIMAIEAGAQRVILCDTNGGILPEEAEEIIKESYKKLEERGLNFSFGVHFHDDCGLALANTLVSLKYIKQVQGTINGIGERVGNLNFSEFLPVYIKKMKKFLNIDLRRLKEINEFAFRISGMEIPRKRAFVGDCAFAHKGGVHIDAVCKGACYEHENPEEFGNKRVILLNTLGGRSSVISLASEFGYKINKNDSNIKGKINNLFNELKKYEQEGYRIGNLRAEQFLLIEKHLKESSFKFEVLEWNVNSGRRDGSEKSDFKITCRLEDEIIEDCLVIEGGPVDAAFKTLKKILEKKYPLIKNLKLVDFHVSIAKRHGEESAVRTEIFFSDGENFSTVGVDKNILGSAVEALAKGFEYYLKIKIVKEGKNESG